MREFLWRTFHLYRLDVRICIFVLGLIFIVWLGEYYAKSYLPGQSWQKKPGSWEARVYDVRAILLLIWGVVGGMLFQ